MRDLPPTSAESTSLTDLLASRPAQAPLTTGLVVVNTLVFALMLVFGASFWHISSGMPLAWGANFGPATQDGQWWRLASAMFVHFGFIHLALNMWALWDVGRLIERVYGRWRFAAIYVGSGILGNLLSLVVQGNQAVSGGASGAVFALYGALMVFLWRERHQFERSEFKWLFGAAVIFTLLTLGMGQLVTGIDNAAHLGGLISGATLALLLARRWTAHSPPVRRGQWLAVLLLLVGTTALITHIPPPSYRLGEEMRAREAIRRFLSFEQRISNQWESILVDGRRADTSFESLAGNIDSQIAAAYQHSFEQLAAINPGTQAPSAQALEALQTYAALRAEAARELADGLRTHDTGKIRRALQDAHNAQTAPPAPTSAASR